MAYDEKEWKDRKAGTPNQRRLIETNVENVYEVERVEGEVTEPGDAFDAENMNDLERRIKAGFSDIRDKDIKIAPNNTFTSTMLDGVLEELFGYASNGKNAIAHAIGGDAKPSDSFTDLAQKIDVQQENYEKRISTQKYYYENQIKEGKREIVAAIGETKNGLALETESFIQLADRIRNDKISYYIGTVTLEPYLIKPGETNVQHFDINFGFIPSYIYAYNVAPYVFRQYDGIGRSGPEGHIIGYLKRRRSSDYEAGIDNLSETGFDYWAHCGVDETPDIRMGILKHVEIVKNKEITIVAIA